MLNRDSKVACSGHQTEDSIVQHSKEYPHIINIAKQYDVISDIKTKKRIPSPSILQRGFKKGSKGSARDKHFRTYL